MTKQELVELLKEYNENVSKLKLRKDEKEECKKILKAQINIETSTTSLLEINSDIRSKNKISDKVGNTVVNEVSISDKKKEEAKRKIVELNNTIQELKAKIRQVNIRLGALHRKERIILYAYYVECRTAEDISQNLYLKKFGRVCSPRYIRKVIRDNTEKMLKL